MDISIGVVEDSDEDYVALSRACSKTGHAITFERWIHAEQLLAAVRDPGPRTQWPQLFFIDLNLPGMDGGDLVAELRSAIPTRPLPLFVLSGSERAADVDRCYAAGASLYLLKPLQPQHLLAAIELLSAAKREHR